jgi:hypothetical protein
MYVYVCMYACMYVICFLVNGSITLYTKSNSYISYWNIVEYLLAMGYNGRWCAIQSHTKTSFIYRLMRSLSPQNKSVCGIPSYAYMICVQIVEYLFAVEEAEARFSFVSSVLPNSKVCIHCMHSCLIFLRTSVCVYGPTFLFMNSCTFLKFE